MSGSSDDEEDFFSSLSKRKLKRKANQQPPLSGGSANAHQTTSHNAPRTIQQGPSTKRHHGSTSLRQQSKMDALLRELEQDQANELSTNIRVNNLEPNVNENQLVDYFRRFGDLYSVKILWPKASGETPRADICFVDRRDAQEALNVTDRTDPFRMGRFVRVWWIDPVEIDPTDFPLATKSRPAPRGTFRHTGRSAPTSSSSRVARRDRSDGRSRSKTDTPAATAVGRPQRGQAILSEDDIQIFQRLFVDELCASRDSVCRAMAFSFERSSAANQIVSLIFDLLASPRPGVSIDTLVARLYVLSDILYNSQQPGIRNAFLYRGAIEKMAPDAGLGRFARKQTGRVRQERLSLALNSVFAAWTNWGVYDPVFIDELQNRFEGREVHVQHKKDDAKKVEPETTDPESVPPTEVKEVVTLVPLGEWIALEPNTSKSQPLEESGKEASSATSSRILVETKDSEEVDTKTPALVESELALLNDKRILAGNEQVTNSVPPDDIDGEPLSDDDMDGLPFDDDADGEALEEDDLDCGLFGVPA